MGNPLQKLLSLGEAEKDARGLKHTPQEIFHQPATWNETYQYCSDRSHEIRTFLKNAGVSRSDTSSPVVFLVGAGSSDYVGRTLTHLLRQRWCCEVYAIPGRALALVLDDAVNDRGLAMTSSFSNMVVAGQCLAHIESVDAYREILECMVQMGPRLISSASGAAFAIAQRMLSRACFVGSGALAAVADESALKVLELTTGKTHTMSQSTLGLRHGPMSGIDENTLFVQFLSNDPRRRNYDLDLLKEIGRKKLGGARLVVTARNFQDSARLAEYVLCLDMPADFRDEYRPPLDVIVGQLLGLFASLRAELKPDCPSPNGTISRVVSGVGIYS